MGKRDTTADEPLVRAEANGYKAGAHKVADEDDAKAKREATEVSVRKDECRECTGFVYDFSCGYLKLEG